jgi:hypothetical protein
MNFTKLSFGGLIFFSEFSGFFFHLLVMKRILDGDFFEHFGRKLQLEIFRILIDVDWPR